MAMFLTFALPLSPMSAMIPRPNHATPHACKAHTYLHQNLRIPQVVLAVHRQVKDAEFKDVPHETVSAFIERFRSTKRDLSLESSLQRAEEAEAV